MTVHLSEKCLYLLSYRQEKTGSNLQIYRVKIATIGIDCCGVARVYLGFGQWSQDEYTGTYAHVFQSIPVFLAENSAVCTEIRWGQGRDPAVFCNTSPKSKKFFEQAIFYKYC